MCAPDPPPPVDYAAQATAQGAANKDAAIVASRLGNPNVINPFGTQTYTDQPIVDGNVIRPTMTQKFSPEQQQIYDKSVEAKTLLGGLGVQGADALQGIVGKRLDLGGVSPIRGYADTRQSVVDDMRAAAARDFGARSEETERELLAAGIRPGTGGHQARLDSMRRAQDDANNLAELAGGNVAGQRYSMDAQRRKDAIAEMLLKRQMPLNEINALMSGSQVTNPFAGVGYSQNANVAPPPIFGAAQAADKAAADQYGAESAAAASKTNAAIGIAAMAAMMMF